MIAYIAINAHFILPFHNLAILVGVGEDNGMYTEKETIKFGVPFKMCIRDRIITHVGHILKYVPASHAHILYQGTLSCTSGDPLDVLSCISKTGYEKCVNGGCRRGMK